MDRPRPWADPVAWAQLRSVEACVICRQGTPNDILAELETSWVTVNEDAPMRGYACLVFRRHAVELVHGNSIPHLHMHFFPRYPGDPFEGGPISPNAARTPVYAPGEITAVRTRLLEALVGVS